MERINEVDANIVDSSKSSDKGNISNCVAEWVDSKSEPFICLALKPSQQKYRLKEKKYSVDWTMCDHIFEDLLKKYYIKLLDHYVMPSLLDLEERIYCKWHNSFEHCTSDCNIFRQKIQSAIIEGRLCFATPRKSYAKDDRFDKRNWSRWSSRKKSSAQVGGSSTGKQIWMPKSRGQEKSLAAGAHVSVQKASVQKKVIELAEHACVQQLENVHHVSMKREASSAELVTSQNPPKSSGCNGSQLRHSHSLSNWQKKQLEKLSAEKLKKRGMAWDLKGSVQVHNEKDANVEVKAKKEKGARRRAPNQRSASNHQVLSPPHLLKSIFLVKCPTTTSICHVHMLSTLNLL